MVHTPPLATAYVIQVVNFEERPGPPDKVSFEAVPGRSVTVSSAYLSPAARAVLADLTRGEVAHACPPRGEALMPCCGRIPFDTPNDRMTLDPDLVTCPGRVAAPLGNGDPT